MAPQPVSAGGVAVGVGSAGLGWTGVMVIFGEGMLKARPKPIAVAARTEPIRPGGFASRIGRKKITPRSRMPSIANIPSGGGLTERGEGGASARKRIAAAAAGDAPEDADAVTE